LEFPIRLAQTSRDHFEVERRAGSLWVRDLGSRNGTFVGGQQLDASSELPVGSIVRAGSTLLLAVADQRPFERTPNERRSRHRLRAHDGPRVFVGPGHSARPPTAL